MFFVSDREELIDSGVPWSETGTALASKGYFVQKFVHYVKNQFFEYLPTYGNNEIGQKFFLSYRLSFLWIGSTVRTRIQCVTASKKLTYKKLQVDFFEKLYPNIRY